VDPARLAAYLAGELSADEHAAVEAALARDPALRADLEALRRADTALAAEAATALPAGARRRLLEALAPVFEETLGDPLAAAPADELAARRRQRRPADRRSWALGLGGAAAAIAAVALIGPVLGGITGGDEAADLDAMSAEEAAPEAAFDDAQTDDAAGGSPLPVGPTLIGSDRALDSEGVAELLVAGELDGVIARELTVDDARGLGQAWVLALGGEPLGLGLSSDMTATARGAEDEAGDGEAGDGEVATTEQDAPAADAEAAADARAATPLQEHGGPADLQLLGEVTDEDLAAVGRCLTTLTTPGDVLVPAFVELVVFEGEPAIAYAMVGAAPDGTMTRREVWVLERADCEVRFLRQG
jgi:hypothetical protein